MLCPGCVLTFEEPGANNVALPAGVNSSTCVFLPPDAEQTDEQLFQEISKVGPCITLPWGNAELSQEANECLPFSIAG